MADDEYEVEEFAENLKSTWLDCRVFGCSRDPKTASLHWVRLEGGRGWALEETTQCRGRCGNWWTQLLDDQGNPLSRLRKHYVYGWVAKGIGRISDSTGKKAILRKERFKRRYADLKQLPKEE